MDSLILTPTGNTPYINFDASKGILDLKGRSTPENSIEFYEPIMNWLDTYMKQPNGTTCVNVTFEYFNTSSSKCILDIFRRIAVLHKNGNEVVINWFFEEDDEDMQEAGEDYSDILGVPFNIQQVKA